MSRKWLEETFRVRKPVIGMVHLLPLPGSPLYDPIHTGMPQLAAIAVEDALHLESGGVDGLQVENIWDYPYLKGSDIGYETVAAMTEITAKVREATALPVGVNCHLNGGFAATAVAVATGAKWVRVFEWVNAYVSHAGVIEGIGSKLSRYRSSLKADEVKYLCDVNVKHGSHFIISDRSIAEQAHDAESEGADLLVATGFETGIPPTREKVRELASAVSLPVLLGSGITASNVAELLSCSDGAIIGSAFKYDGNWKNRVSEENTRAFMREARLVQVGD
ncbi:MAG: BtpA/SgcQ family protein [Clostridiales Family XIII bacterium]|nr:BtpA/SgcQ family protein [Clostridiales Family XIII bacterium]